MKRNLFLICICSLFFIACPALAVQDIGMPLDDPALADVYATKEINGQQMIIGPKGADSQHLMKADNDSSKIQIAYNAWDPSFSQRNWTFAAGYPEEIPRPAVNLLLANNIFAFNTGPAISDPTGIYLGPGVNLTEHHNLYFSREDGEITAEFLEREFTRGELGDGSWANATGQGEGILTVDPFFVSGWPEVDLGLLLSSPAINAGD